MGTRHFWIRQAQHVIQLLFNRNLSKKQGAELSLQGTEWVGRGSSLPQGSSPPSHPAGSKRVLCCREFKNNNKTKVLSWVGNFKQWQR